MIHFDEAHRAVYYPDDWRFRIWIRPSILIPLLILALGPFVLAWIQNAIFGLPYIAPAAARMKALRAARMAFRSGFVGAISSPSFSCSCSSAAVSPF
jgi:hypothetical protein